jgi:hypothetical protein
MAVVAFCGNSVLTVPHLSSPLPEIGGGIIFAEKKIPLTTHKSNCNVVMSLPFLFIYFIFEIQHWLERMLDREIQHFGSDGNSDIGCVESNVGSEVGSAVWLQTVLVRCIVASLMRPCHTRGQHPLAFVDASAFHLESLEETCKGASEIVKLDFVEQHPME